VIFLEGAVGGLLRNVHLAEEKGVVDRLIETGLSSSDPSVYLSSCRLLASLLNKSESSTAVSDTVSHLFSIVDREQSENSMGVYFSATQPYLFPYNTF